jgi:hypothetical protein
MKSGFFGLEQLNFVEFNTSGDEVNYQKFSESSRFLSSEVFNLFVHCFENSHELYEYFEPSKFNARRIIVLRNELLKNIEILMRIESKEQFMNHIENVFLGKAYIDEMTRTNHNWHNAWKIQLDMLISVNKEMLEIIDSCLENEQVLWLIGY